MSFRFVAKVNEMLSTNEGYQSRIGPAPAVNPQRVDAMGQALHELANLYGVELKRPIRANTWGELPIVAQDEKNETEIGKFGPDFSALLSQFGPRTGVLPTTKMSENSGWCVMKVRDVESLLLDVYTNLAPNYVVATVSSLDNSSSVTFDVAPFLTKLSDAELIGLASKNWSGKTVEKALEFTLPNNSEVSSIVCSAECDKLSTNSCLIDKESADSWLQKNRPHLWEIAQDMTTSRRPDLTLSSGGPRFSPH